MTREEVIDLLSIAASYDKRIPAAMVVDAWLDAATRMRWTYPEAADAVKDHYARSTDWLMPAHITAWIKDRRRDAAMRQPAIETSTPTASEEHRRAAIARVVSEMAERKRVPE